MEDGEIVALFLQREETAIAETARKYGSRLRVVTRRLGVSAEDAEEIENETYHTAWQRIPPHEPREYLFFFLAKIARGKAIDRLRKESRRKAVLFTELCEEAEQCIPSPDDIASRMEEQELGKAISRFLRSVPEEKRNIFLRRYWFGDPLSDISRRFGISESKVKVTLFRLRKELKEYLRKEGYEI